jgi:hypothetical protein
VRPKEPRGSVPCVGEGFGDSLARESSGSMKAARRRWRRAVQERRAVRRAVRRGERRSVQRAGAGEVQEMAVSSAVGEGEDPGGGSILANH